jgi:glycosyltransferase involved in cell wall biosynthesis
VIGSIGVVIPARDEEEMLGAALGSVTAARAELVRAEPFWAGAGRVRIVLVLDACTDGSLSIARSFAPAVEVVEIDARNVGRARRAGVERVLGRSGPGSEPARLWICSTDADTEVPANWLRDHLQAARDGAEVAVGRVVPRAADVGSALLAAWRREHEGGGRHVYGANLGCRADAYLAAGGFPPLRVGEDVEFVRSAERNGAAVLDLPFSVVQTSGRRIGRTPGGFAGYLRTLAE